MEAAPDSGLDRLGSATHPRAPCLALQGSGTPQNWANKLCYEKSSGGGYEV